jgi:hypothetical protein
MSKNLRTFWKNIMAKEAGDISRLLTLVDLYKYLLTIPDELIIMLPPSDPGTGTAPNEPPVNMNIGSAMEFFFTKESTRNLVQSELKGDYNQLYTLTWETLFKYLQKSLDGKVLKATGLMAGSMITIFIRENKGVSFEMTIRVSRHLFRMFSLKKRFLTRRNDTEGDRQN